MRQGPSAAVRPPSAIRLLALAAAACALSLPASGAEAGATPPKCTLKGTPNSEKLIGTTHRDVICAGGGADLIVARKGDDIVRGGDGRDRIEGGPGDDAEYGNDGADRLLGMAGDDKLVGGAGSDSIDGGIGLNACAYDPLDSATDCVDEKPPVLTSLNISPRSVDTTTSPALVEISVGASDELAGVKQVWLYLTAPSTEPGASSWGLGGPTRGTIQRGVWVHSATLAKLSKPGEWTLTAVVLEDQADNRSRYTRDELAAAGYATNFTQTGAEDTEPPRLTGLRLSQRTVDVSYADTEIRVDSTAVDGGSGVSQVFVWATRVGDRPGGLSGTGWGSRFVSYLDVPRYHPTGVFELNVSILDRAGNRIEYGARELEALGLPSTVELTGVSDETPPRLTSLSVSPRTIDTGTGAKTIYVHVGAADDLAGVDQISGYIQGPAGTFDIRTYGLLPAGTRNDGVWSLPVTIPAYSARGTYRVVSLGIVDGAEQGAGYGEADFAAAGFSASFTNARP